MSVANDRVLVVDDDADVARCLADVLSAARFHVRTTSSGDDAIAACQEESFGAVVSDVYLPGMNGIDLMAQLKQVQPGVQVILVSGRASVLTAVDAIKRGAFDYVSKPCDAVQLRALVERACSQARALDGVRALPPVASGRRRFGANHELIGESPRMKALRGRIELVASTCAPVLIQGETGTGKELVARAIHAGGPRARQPFVAVNASAIPETLLESEMFGHVRGAFTGATHAHRGHFAQADGGTLFLDEIGDMPLPLQAKLLRVLQTGEILPVGSGRVDYVDVRVLAATHQRLPELVRAGRFREDLFYRLNVLTVSLPPLRKRTDDIESLAAFFLARAKERAPQARAASIREDLTALLARRPWPGNIRELESAIERLVVLSPDAELTPEHMSLIDEEPAELTVEAAATCTIDELVRRHVIGTLARTGGNKSHAAKLLGIDLSTLYRWQQKWRTSNGSLDA